MERLGHLGWSRLCSSCSALAPACSAFSSCMNFFWSPSCFSSLFTKSRLGTNSVGVEKWINWQQRPPTWFFWGVLHNHCALAPGLCRHLAESSERLSCCVSCGISFMVAAHTLTCQICLVLGQNRQWSNCKRKQTIMYMITLNIIINFETMHLTCTIIL